MTTLTALGVPARLEEVAALRPLPWRRMAWVTWRQHRVALGSVAALLGALAAYMWIVGLQLHHTYAAATGCHPASSAGCADLVAKFNNVGSLLANGLILQAVPALIGAFVGAPVLARELETGTFRYAWTMGFGRWRWALAKLVALAVVVAAAAGALSALLSWYYQPYFATRNQTVSLHEWSPFVPSLFDLRGLAFAGWALAAFAIACLAGTLTRRVVPAIVVTLGAYTALALATGAFLRQHYLTPVATTKLSLPGSAWILSQWGTKGGKVAFAGTQPSNVFQLCPPSVIGPGKGQPGSLSVAHCIVQHGYTLWTTYQPASRFWPFQYIEGGWLFAMSVLLITVTVLLVRRRAA
jgi:hypothetical protein